MTKAKHDLMKQAIQKFREGVTYVHPTIKYEVTLLEEVYGVLLCTHVWTKPGGPWHEPDYPGYAKHVTKIMKEFETLFLHGFRRPPDMFDSFNRHPDGSVKDERAEAERGDTGTKTVHEKYPAMPPKIVKRKTRQK